MGIRFFCPNGHRLNVKSFLAGKRGVCPECGVPVDIPMESDARAVSKKKASNAAKAANSPSGNGHSATAVLDGPAAKPIASHDDFALPADITAGPKATISPITITTPGFAIETVRPLPQPLAPDKAVPAPVQPANAEAVLPPAAGSASRLKNPVAKPAVRPAPPPASAPPAVDPIAEAPMAIWYVRPVAGGQYGPARGDVMRKWLSEGRVTADSLVWREGWPDWRAASKVFPNLGPGTGTRIESPVLPDVSRRPIRPHRKPSMASGIGIVVALGVVCLGLFAALIYVLMNSGGTTTP